MKKGWLTKTLGDVCEVFADGDWVESKDQSSEGIRLIQTGNVGEGVFKDRVEKARYISEATFKRLRCTEIVEGDCLVSRLPDPVGRSCILPYTDGRMITAVDCTILRFNPKQLLPTFFNFYSQSDDYLTAVAKECTGTTRNRISRSNLGKTPIPAPPLAEQQRIVGLLDEAFAGLATAKANAEKNLQNARAFFESHLQLVFKEGGEGWVEKPFEDCIEDVTYTTKIQRKEFLKVGNFPIVSQEADFINGFWNNGADVFRVTRPVVIFGDHTQVLKYIDFDFVLGADGVKILPPKLFLNPKFFYYCLRSISVNSLGYARHYRLLKELEIRYPDRSMQTAIAKRFEVLEAETQRLTQLYERKLAALEELKKSLLHQAFNGEL